MAHHEKQKCTPLYSFTFPVQKKCVIPTHRTGKALTKINEENMIYNAAQEYRPRMIVGEKNSQGINFTSW